MISDSAVVTKARAYLRFYGVQLDPALVSRRLGVQATESARVGQSQRTKAGKVRIAPTGYWFLESPATADTDLSSQIAELMLAVRLMSPLPFAYETAEVDCFVFGENDVILGPELLHQLSAVGISLRVQFFC